MGRGVEEVLYDDCGDGETESETRHGRDGTGDDRGRSDRPQVEPSLSLHVEWGALGVFVVWRSVHRCEAWH